MLKKWWFWLLLILFIAINLLINDQPNDDTEIENDINQQNSEISTH